MIWVEICISNTDGTLAGIIRHDKLDYMGADGWAQGIAWGCFGDGCRFAAVMSGVSVRSTKNINMVYTGVRKGHPTPMAFAMQSRHIF